MCEHHIKTISTTNSIQACDKFAVDNGIMITFHRFTKYFDVVDITDFTEESEALFFGQNIQFKIKTISTKKYTKYQKPNKIWRIGQSGLIQFEEILHLRKNQIYNFKQLNKKNEKISLIQYYLKQQQNNSYQNIEHITIYDDVNDIETFLCIF